MKRGRFPNLRRIREERKSAGDADATLSKYAELARVDIGQLSRIERGLVGRIEVGAALRIAKLYGVEVESLVRGAA